MVKDFTTATKTVSGYSVKNVHWNNVANAYLGFVADPNSYINDFVTCMWDKRGKCKNSLRTDCNLVFEK